METTLRTTVNGQLKAGFTFRLEYIKRPPFSPSLSTRRDPFENWDEGKDRSFLAPPAPPPPPLSISSVEILFSNRRGQLYPRYTLGVCALISIVIIIRSRSILSGHAIAPPVEKDPVGRSVDRSIRPTISIEISRPILSYSLSLSLFLFRFFSSALRAGR